MENTVIKKRLNTYKSDGGRLSNVEDEVVLDVLRAWENWQGTTAELYRELGLTKRQLVKKGATSGGAFKEITVSKADGSNTAGYAVEITWEHGRLVRFKEVSQLVEFLKFVGKDADV